MRQPLLFLRKILTTNSICGIILLVIFRLPQTENSTIKLRDMEFNMEIAEILEIIMIVSFGVSWPINVIKSYRARTTKGKSLWFLLLILFGYVAGIAAKLSNAEYMASFSDKWYVLIFYILNFIMVSIDLGMYIRNYKLDKKRKNGEQV